MDLIGSFIIACSMYSRLPMPRIEWTEKRMAYAMCFFPAVGIVTGTVLAVLGYLSKRFGWNGLFYAGMGTVLPILITGGIHMDGFLDVSDARGSCKSQEEKLEILKDPRVGAFAVIRTAVYLILYLSVFSLLKPEHTVVFSAAFVMTRALSGWSVVSFPKARREGLVSTFSRQANAGVVRISMAVWYGLAGMWIYRYGGLWTVVSCVGVSMLCMIWYRRMADKEFGGITGDLAGYFLQICEFWLLVVTVFMTG